MTHQDDIHDEFGPVVDRLRANRPTATALELDAAKQRVLARAATHSRNRRARDFMRSRVAILATLVLGLTFSTTGAGLAISGFTDGDQASVAQYPGQNTPGGSVLPGGDVRGTTDEQPGDSVRGATGEGVQPSRQLARGAQSADESTLPFTGFAAIPILLAGVALLGTGLVLRRNPSAGD